LRHGLDTLPPAPPVEVDLSRLYQEAARRQERRLRRWRLTAVALAAAAAGLLLVLEFLNLEVRFDEHQLVVRWGSPPPPPVVKPQEPTHPPVVQAPPTGSPVSPAEVQLLRDLIYALDADVRLRDQKQQQALSQLRSRLDSLQEKSDRRWAEAELTQRAFYTALFGPRDAKGGRP